VRTPAEDGPLPDGYDELNAYSRIIVDEARRQGISVHIVDPGRGELVLSRDGRTVRTLESLSELTSAVAFRICDDKRHTRQVLERAGIPVPPGRTATFDESDTEFLIEHQILVVKPARGEQGQGVTVGVTDPAALERALRDARHWCSDVLLERRVEGQDLRVVVIGDEVVAAAVRRPAYVVGDGRHTVTELIETASRRREGETDGASTIPLDDHTLQVVREAGYEPGDVLPDGVELTVGRTANLHTGGTIHDVTAVLHPALAEMAVNVARAIRIPVVGVDLVVDDPRSPVGVVVEANEQPGLANHEPQPTAQRFIVLLFPRAADPAHRSSLAVPNR
jgi:GNAT-family acetyltransferase (TIGR03103 family)